LLNKQRAPKGGGGGMVIRRKMMGEWGTY